MDTTDPQLARERDPLGRRDLLKRGAVAAAAAGVVFSAGRIDGLSLRPSYAGAQSGGPIDPGDPGMTFDFDREVGGANTGPVGAALGPFGDGVITYRFESFVDGGFNWDLDFSGPAECAISGWTFDFDPPDTSSFTDSHAAATWGGSSPEVVTSHLQITCV